MWRAEGHEPPLAHRVSNAPFAPSLLSSTFRVFSLSLPLRCMPHASHPNASSYQIATGLELLSLLSIPRTPLLGYSGTLHSARYIPSFFSVLGFGLNRVQGYEGFNPPFFPLCNSGVLGSCLFLSVPFR